MSIAPEPECLKCVYIYIYIVGIIGHRVFLSPLLSLFSLFSLFLCLLTFPPHFPFSTLSFLLIRICPLSPSTIHSHPIALQLFPVAQKNLNRWQKKRAGTWRNEHTSNNPQCITVKGLGAGGTTKQALCRRAIFSPWLPYWNNGFWNSYFRRTVEEVRPQR